eukprot:9502330-Pyramimonas_sp.AAC.1
MRPPPLSTALRGPIGSSTECPSATVHMRPPTQCSLLGRLGDLVGRVEAVLRASWAFVERSWGPLGPSWSVGGPKGQ